jgi:hypothetical protein
MIGSSRDIRTMKGSCEVKEGELENELKKENELKGARIFFFRFSLAPDWEMFFGTKSTLPKTTQKIV